METISETVNKTTVNVLNKSENSTKQSAVTDQSMKLSGLDISGCTLEYTQSATATLTAMQSISASTSADLVSAITAKLAESANNAASAKSSLGSQPSNSSTITKTIQSVKTDLKASLTTENINKIIQDVNTKQKTDISGLHYDACNVKARMAVINENPALANTAFGLSISSGVNDCMNKNPLPKCDISQITTSNLVAQQITNSVMGVVAKNQDAQDLIANLSSTSTATSSGVADVLTSFFSGITGLFSGIFGGLGAYASMLCFCCCCCCCCLLILMIAVGTLTPGEEGGANTGGANNAAASAAQNAIRQAGGQSRT
jgi:hypothetical protein